MKQKFLLLIIFIILYKSPLLAENKYTFPEFANETVDFISLPIHWNGNDYLKMGIVCAGTGALMFADQPIRDAVQKDHRYYYSVPLEFGRMWGEYYSPIAFFGGFAIFSLITDDIATRKIAYEIGQASIYAGVISTLLKVSIGRARPLLNRGPGTYRPFVSLFSEDYHSIPGGHNFVAFTISTVLSRNVKPVWLKVLFYAPAALTFYSRVYQDKHWTSDDFIGAAMGYYIATWCVDQHEKVVKSDTTETGQGLMERIQIQPIVTGDYFGINLSIPLF
jgi:membrane-associated phospholipid phosphatase